MKNLKIYAASLAICATSAVLPALAQQTRVLTADKHNEYGVVYNLPVTAIEFQITARRTSTIAGPYYQYAKKFLGTTKAPSQDSEKWEIVSVKAYPYGVADTESRYLMQVKPGAVTSITVAEDGMLLAINSDAEAPSVPAAADDSEPAIEVHPRDYLQYVNEDFLASQSTAKQAQMLSESLMEVRDAKLSLTRGTADSMPTDGRQLELMLASLAHQEKALTAAFTGTTETQTVTRTFSFTPKGENERVTLFRMSDFAGFVEADDLAGAPVNVTVKVLSKGELPVDSKGEEKKLPKDAVIYNIPGAAHIALQCEGKTLWSGDVELAQLGVQFGLNPSLFSDKKQRSKAIFSPVTGGLVEISEVDD
ncbi:MAG: DUF4831 family protein [Muribaculaceae bacterium]|nr:DUF4831 family protein [Muribaculaceae bacterium]